MTLMHMFTILKEQLVIHHSRMDENIVVCHTMEYDTATNTNKQQRQRHE